jgi:hypothetical protein
MGYKYLSIDQGHKKIYWNNQIIKKIVQKKRKIKFI